MTAKQDKPWIANYPDLKDWLDKLEARCQWQRPLTRDPDEPMSGYLEGWLVNGVLVIVFVRSHRDGWEIFTPCTDPSIAAALRDAETRCGLVPK